MRLRVKLGTHASAVVLAFERFGPKVALRRTPKADDFLRVELSSGEVIPVRVVEVRNVGGAPFYVLERF